MRKNRKNNSRTRGKRICIVAILLASSLILAGCGIKKEEIEDSELPEIVIGIDYFEPYSYQTDDGQYKGMMWSLQKKHFGGWDISRNLRESSGKTKRNFWKPER